MAATGHHTDNLKSSYMDREGVQELAPAGPQKGMMKSVYQTPGEFTPEIQHLTNCIRILFQARTMEEHHRALNFLDMDVHWDNPFALLRGRDKLRTYFYFVKAFFKFDFAPKVVNVRMLNERRAEVEIDGITRLYPIKNVWTLAFAPLMWLLPEHIDLQENFTLGIKAETDRVSLLKVRIQNWPALPNIVRWTLSFIFGQMAVWTEGAWSRTLSWFGDYSYETERPQSTYGQGYGPSQYGSGQYGSSGPTVGQRAQGALDSAKAMGQHVVNRVQDAGYRAAETVSSTANQAGSTLTGQGGDGTGYGSSYGTSGHGTTGSAGAPVTGTPGGTMS